MDTQSSINEVSQAKGGIACCIYTLFWTLIWQRSLAYPVIHKYSYLRQQTRTLRNLSGFPMLEFNLGVSSNFTDTPTLWIFSVYHIRIYFILRLCKTYARIVLQFALYGSGFQHNNLLSQIYQLHVQSLRTCHMAFLIHQTSCKIRAVYFPFITLLTDCITLAI
jgi:hypothetical protein